MTEMHDSAARSSFVVKLVDLRDSLPSPWPLKAPHYPEEEETLAEQIRLAIGKLRSLFGRFGVQEARAELDALVDSFESGLLVVADGPAPYEGRYAIIVSLQQLIDKYQLAYSHDQGSDNPIDTGAESRGYDAIRHELPYQPVEPKSERPHLEESRSHYARARDRLLDNPIIARIVLVGIPVAVVVGLLANALNLLGPGPKAPPEELSQDQNRDRMATEIQQIKNKIVDEADPPWRLYSQLGEVYFRLERTGEAEEAFRKSIREKPGIANQLYLGTILCQSDRYEAAYKSFEGAAAEAREAIDEYRLARVVVQHADCLRRQAKHSEALSKLEEVELIATGDPGFFLVRGEVYRLLKKPASAIPDFLTAIAMDLGTPLRQKSALHNLGIALADIGRLSEAEETQRKALEIDPEYAPALDDLGEIRKKQGKYSAAREFYDAAIKADPSRVSAYYNTVTTYCLEELCQEAEESLEQYGNLFSAEVPGLGRTWREVLSEDEEMDYCRISCAGFVPPR